MTSRSCLANFAIVALTLSACGAPATHDCTPGLQQVCPCPGAGQGVQVCNEAGNGFGACTGCGTEGQDSGGVDLLSSVDRSLSPDLTTENDLAEAGAATPDLSAPDQARPDLSSVDLATSDLAYADLAYADLAQPDFAAGQDLAGCGPGQKKCGLACISNTSCCTNNECVVLGQTCQNDGTCACAVGEKACGMTCITNANCCTGADCLSGVCNNGVCGFAGCSDSVKNGLESDVDCGGGCLACVLGKACGTGADCLSGVCTAKACDWPAGLSRPTAYGASPEMTRFVMGDFNGDNKPDIAELSEFYGGVRLLLGTGAGTFNFSSTAPFANLPITLVAVDANGDGKLDVVTIGAGQLQTFLGNGNGTLQSPIALVLSPSLGTHGFELSRGDFDGDGKADLVLTQGQDVYVLMNGGNGSFQAPALAFSSDAFGYVQLHVADFNRDGRSDVALFTMEGVGILLANQKGVLQPELQYAYMDVLSYPNLGVGDINGDGVPDLAMTSGSPSVSLFVQIGNGDGTFQPVKLVGSAGNAVGAGPYSTLLAADLTGDHKLDFVMPNYDNAANTEQYSVLPGDGAGAFQSAAQTPLSNSPQYPATADVDGDGKADIINMELDGLRVYFGSANGVLSPGSIFDGGLFPNALGLAMADFNGDGKPDVVVDSRRGGTVQASVAMGNGKGGFQAGGIATVMNIDLRQLAAGDLTGDGKQDVVLLDGNGGLVVLPGQGDGTLGGALSYPHPTNGTTTTMVVGDLNGDGKLDALAGTAGGYGVSWIAGAGTLTPSDSYQVYGQVVSIALGDYNRDGRLDAAVLDTSGKVTILAGMGAAGQFQPGATMPVSPSYSGAITSADFDGDGRLDLAVVGGTAPCSIFLGNGDGTFRAPSLVSITSYSHSGIAAADFNRDGKMDLIIQSITSLSFLAGNGNGTFQPMLNYEGRFTGLGIADLNVDGKPDVAAISSDGVAVLLDTF